jgi:hypothetical protein
MDLEQDGATWKGRAEVELMEKKIVSLKVA